MKNTNVVKLKILESTSIESKLKRYKHIHDEIKHRMAELDLLKKEISTLVTDKKMDACYENITVLYKDSYTRMSWDSKGLKAYAEIHPEIDIFKKEVPVKETMMMRIH